MTTARQVKTLLTTVAEYQPDLILIGNVLVFKPVCHLFRGIMIDRSGDAGRFRPRWAVAPLLFKLNEFPVGLGQLIYRQGLWFFSEPDIAQRLAETIEHDVLPRFRVMDSLLSYTDTAIPKNVEDLNYSWNSHFFCSLAVGDIDTVRAFLAGDKSEAVVRIFNKCSDRLGDRLREQGAQLTMADRKAVAQMLHNWEAHSAEKLKIEHLWQRTPFPLECAT